MISYNARAVPESGFTAADLALLARAQEYVAALVEPPGVMLRCHEVARAVGRALDLPVVDGHFGRVEHSWLITTMAPPGLTPLAQPGRARRLGPFDRVDKILDVYAVGSLPQVQMHSAYWSAPHYSNYHPGPDRPDIDAALVDALSAQLGKSCGCDLGSEGPGCLCACHWAP